jgi:anti-anti-sigma regulatory factor
MRALATTEQVSGRPARSDAPRGATSASVTVVVGPIGRLEGEQSAAFRRRLVALSMVDGADVAVDLAAVPAMDDAAARCLADVGMQLKASAGRLRVYRSRSQPRAQLQAVAMAAELFAITSNNTQMGDWS